MNRLASRSKSFFMNLAQFLKTTPKAVFFVFIIYFFQGVIHNLGHPVTPAFVRGQGIEDYYFGIYFAAMAFGLLVGSPLWGILGDRGNKRQYVFFGLILYSIGQVLFAYVSNQYWMILFRFISGFGVSASITLLMSHLIENSQEDRRKMFLGWYQALFVLGSSLGYWLSGELTSKPFFIELLNTTDYRNIFLIQAVWNVFHACYIFFMIGKDRVIVSVIDSDIVEKPKKLGLLAGFKAVRKLDTNLIIFLISLSLISLGMINVSKFIEVYMDDINLLPSDIGDFVGLTGIVSLIATIVLVPIVARMKKDFKIMILIQLLSAVIIFLVFRQENIMLALYTGFMLYIVLKALYSPLEQHYIASHAPTGKYGSIMGVRQSFFAIGMVVGPLVGGILYDLKPIYAFDFSGIMFVIGFVLLVIIGKRIRKTEQNI